LKRKERREHASQGGAPTGKGEAFWGFFGAVPLRANKKVGKNVVRGKSREIRSAHS